MKAVKVTKTKKKYSKILNTNDAVKPLDLLSTIIQISQKKSEKLETPKSSSKNPYALKDKKGIFFL